MSKVVQPLFQGSRGFAKVRLSSPITSCGALWTYKALLIELSKRGLLKRAQESRVWFRPAIDTWVYDSTQGSEGSLPDTIMSLVAVPLEYSLETDPPGIGFTSLVTGYMAEIPSDPNAHASWALGIDLPPSLLEYVHLRVTERKDWIQAEMYPAFPSQPFQMPQWPTGLQISCSAR
jgi:hypothetical protein